MEDNLAVYVCTCSLIEFSTNCVHITKHSLSKPLEVLVMIGYVDHLGVV